MARSRSAIGQNSSGWTISKVGAMPGTDAMIDIRVSLVKVDIVSPGRSKRCRAFKLI